MRDLAPLLLVLTLLSGDRISAADPEPAADHEPAAPPEAPVAPGPPQDHLFDAIEQRQREILERINEWEASLSALESGSDAAATPPTGRTMEMEIPGESEPVEVLLSPAQVQTLENQKQEILRMVAEWQELAGVRQLLQDESIRALARERIAGAAPLTPDQAIEFRQRVRDALEGRNRPLSTIRQRMRTVQHTPASTEPIRLTVAPGYISSILFTDKAGKPWPVQAASIADADAFRHKVYDPHKNLVAFEVGADALFSETNALFLLAEMQAPLVVVLHAEPTAVDARLNVQIPTLGPLATEDDLTAETSTAPLADDMMRAALDDPWSIPGATYFDFDNPDVPGTLLQVTDGTNKARLFLRTSAELLSPPHVAALVGPAGTNVYEVPPVDRFLLMRNDQILRTGATPRLRPAIQEKRPFYEAEPR